MGYVITFIVGAWFGIVLMGLCMVAQRRWEEDEKRFHDEGGKNV